MQKTRVRSLSQKDPLEEEMAPHCSILAWKIPRTEEPGRLQGMGSQRVRCDQETEYACPCSSGYLCPWHVAGVLCNSDLKHTSSQLPFRDIRLQLEIGHSGAFTPWKLANKTNLVLLSLHLQPQEPVAQLLPAHPWGHQPQRVARMKLINVQKSWEEHLALVYRALSVDLECWLWQPYQLALRANCPPRPYGKEGN